jgi:hypothetical protein
MELGGEEKMKIMLVIVILIGLIGATLSGISAFERNPSFVSEPLKLTIPVKSPALTTPDPSPSISTFPDLSPPALILPDPRYPQAVPIIPTPINYEPYKPPKIIKVIDLVGETIESPSVSAVIEKPLVSEPVQYLVFVPIPPIICSGTGEIRYLDFECGFYGIVSDDGRCYDPVNLPSEFKNDGLQINFKVKVLENQISFHMWGTLVEILEIGVMP